MQRARGVRTQSPPGARGNPNQCDAGGGDCVELEQGHEDDPIHRPVNPGNRNQVNDRGRKVDQQTRGKGERR